MTIEREIPDISDELNRKTVDELKDLTIKKNNRDVTDTQYALAVRSLWQATSGLVSEDVAKIFNAIDGEASKNKDFATYSLIKGGKVALIKHLLNGCKYVFMLYDENGKRLKLTKKDFSKEDNGAEMCINKVAELVEGLKRKKFIYLG
jgi:hypothetical protein